MEIARCAELAKYFRDKLVENNLPFEIVSESLSNAVTPLHPITQSAFKIFLKMKDTNSRSPRSLPSLHIFKSKLQIKILTATLDLFYTFNRN